jgi:predicted RNase H-like HicB family nuclease
MVHVLDLVGCIAKGPTTDDALNRTPEAIRAYLRFLKRHGQAVDPGSEFETVVAEHVTKGE